MVEVLGVIMLGLVVGLMVRCLAEAVARD